jgi:hypothetical protein
VRFSCSLPAQSSCCHSYPQCQHRVATRIHNVKDKVVAVLNYSESDVACPLRSLEDGMDDAAGFTQESHKCDNTSDGCNGNYSESDVACALGSLDDGMDDAAGFTQDSHKCYNTSDWCNGNCIGDGDVMTFS